MFKSNSPHAAFFTSMVVVIGAMVVFSLLLQSHQPARHAGRPVGTQLPPIKAQGWLNGEAPTSEELANKVLVIDAWASWCGPCIQQAPELVLLHERYHAQGVEFIGLTGETEEHLEAMQRFLKRTGITWKSGYGTNETLRELGVDAIPMVWVVDRHNQIVWNQSSSISLEEGIRQALAAP